GLSRGLRRGFRRRHRSRGGAHAAARRARRRCREARARRRAVHRHAQRRRLFPRRRGALDRRVDAAARAADARGGLREDSPNVSAAALMIPPLGVWWQHLFPQALSSRAVYRLARSRQPSLKNALIRGFTRLYAVDLSQARRKRAEDYESFNDFFTRELVAGARPIADDPEA